MNPGIRGLTSRFAPMPVGLLGAPRPIAMPHLSWHPEAIDWATRAAANGGVVSTANLSAVSELCDRADADGWRSAMFRLNTFTGGNLSGCLVPLFRGPVFGGAVFGNLTDTAVNFVSADFLATGPARGLKGNGTNKYLDTGFAQASLKDSLKDSFRIHVSASASSMEIAPGNVFCLIGASGNVQINLWAAVTTQGRAFQGGVGSADSAKFANPTTAESLLIGVRQTVTELAIYSAGALRGTSAATSGAANITDPFFIFARNASGAGAFSAARMRTYSIGDYLTGVQVASFTQAIENFNAAMGR